MLFRIRHTPHPRARARKVFSVYVNDQRLSWLITKCAGAHVSFPETKVPCLHHASRLIHDIKELWAPMKILVVHSFYRQDVPSGENVAVEQMVNAMRSGGFDVTEFYRYTDLESKKPLFGLRSAVSALTGLDWSGAADSVDWSEIDVVNAHNTFPNFGSNWLKSCRRPLVTTVHNFRFTCANGLLYRDGRLCLDCVASAPWPGVKNGCYQGSVIKSIPVALGPHGKGVSSPILTASRHVIAQTPRVRELLSRTGFPPERTVLVPGFVEDLKRPISRAPIDIKYVVVGRDTPEKGVAELLAIWPAKKRLDVIGTRNSKAAAEEGNGWISFRGTLSRDVIRRELQDYTALIFPGRVWEGALPLVVREAAEAGIPVVAFDGSSAADFVRETGAGRVYYDRASLRRVLHYVEERNQFLRKTARTAFTDSLSEERWLASMTELLLRTIG